MSRLSDRSYRFGVRHPRIAIGLYVLFVGVGGLVILDAAETSLPSSSRQLFRDYLLRVGVGSFLVGLAVMVIAFRRHSPLTRDPARIVSNYRWGAQYGWVGVVLAGIAFTLCTWLNPVRMPWSPLPGLVAVFGLLAPWLAFSAIRVFVFAKSPPSPALIEELASEEPTDKPTG